MELYLDSVNLDEIKAANKLGYLKGLTTTPTFMLREGVTDIDAMMLELATMVDVLQVEALGDNADEIVAEAKRLVSIGLSKEKTVFKIPISMEGTQACKRLVDEGYQVNLHLVYTLQQAYLAMCAGATYVCPLVGRLQDQGQYALKLVEECVKLTEKYGYKTKVMFSSVRHVEHVKNALEIGVHTCTVPWKVMKKLADNHFTTIGTDQFITDTKMLTSKVGDVVRTEHVTIASSAKVIDAIITMTKSKLGAVVVLDNDGGVYRIFTDGDVRRLLEMHHGQIQDLVLSDLEGNSPVSVDKVTNFQDALNTCTSKKIDTIMVSDQGKFVGLVDIQDLVK